MISLHYASHTEAYNIVYTACNIVEQSTPLHSIIDFSCIVIFFFFSIYYVCVFILSVVFCYFTAPNLMSSLNSMRVRLFIKRD